MPTGTLERPTRQGIDERLMNRLVTRVLDDTEFEQYCTELAAGARRRLAVQVVDQALDFLLFLAGRPGAGFSYSPSPLVDVGWHAFILHTREYHDFCLRVAGQFIHHDPVDDLADGVGPLPVGATAAAMKAAGFGVVDDIWGAVRRKGKGKGKGGSGGGGSGGDGGGDSGGGDSGGGGCGGGG